VVKRGAHDRGGSGGGGVRAAIVGMHMSACSGRCTGRQPLLSSLQVERLPVPELAEEGNERYSSSTTTGGEAREAWGAGHKVDEGLAARLDHACPP
jgi:hypothetical protein